MMKILKINEVFEKAQAKFEKLKNNAKITDENIDIFYAVVSANSMFDIDSTYIYSIKVSILKNLFNTLKISIDVDDLNDILLAKSTCEILCDFCNDDNTYFFSNVYAGETDVADFDVLRDRFIIICDDENEIEYVYKLSKSIADLRCMQIDLKDFKKEYPNFKINRECN